MYHHEIKHSKPRPETDRTCTQGYSKADTRTLPPYGIHITRNIPGKWKWLSEVLGSMPLVGAIIMRALTHLHLL